MGTNRRARSARRVLAAFAASLTTSAFAQSPVPAAPAAASAATLPLINVTALRLSQDILTTPAAVDVIKGRDVTQGRRKTQLDSALNRSPGVYANNGSNFAQNLRVSIRGFGARSAFGVRGVQVIEDGIPETLVDGQAQTDSIDLGAIQRITVLRGPFSALYGNATGGVIDIDTLSPDDGPRDEAEISAGSNGYQRQSVSTAHRSGPWGVSATASRLHQSGYRAHSDVLKNQFTGKLERDIGPTGTLTLITRLLDAPDTEDPGAITESDARADRHAARDANLAYDARQTANQYTFGAVYDDQLSAAQTYKAHAFYTRRDFIQYLPFTASGVVGYQRNFFGGGVQTTRRDAFFGHDNQLVAGLDAKAQQDNRQRYDNDFGNRGALGFAEQENATNVGLFAQDEFSIAKRLQLTLGARYDWLDFSIHDHFLSDGNDSGGRDFKRLSVNGGLSYGWATHQRVYFNIANAFESPTFTEFANPDGGGGFNPDLAPQKAVNYEIGAKGLFGGRGRYQLDAFLINVRDELVVFNDDGERDFYQNSGRSRRQGIESKIDYDLGHHLSATAAYTLASYEFRQFVDENGNDFAGNRIPGIPQQTLFSELAWRRTDIGYAVLDAHYVGSIKADDANAHGVGGRTVMDARIGKTIPAGGDHLTVFFGVDNLFDKAYFDNIRINAFAARYYEPAPGRSIYAGLNYRL